jgi:hypothetical protein
MIIIHAVYVRDPKDVMATCAQPRLTSKQEEAGGAKQSNICPSLAP